MTPRTSSEPSSESPRYLRVAFLGVSFRWDNPRWEGFDKANLEAGAVPQQRFMDLVAAPMKRQRRTHHEYWDAMTYLERVPPPEPLASTAEAEVAVELIGMLGRGRARDKTIIELTQLPLIAASRARLVPYGDGLSNPLFVFTPRKGSPPQAGLTHDPALPKGIYRTIDVDMTALGGSAKAIDWERLFVQAVLVQLYADLEIYYETGFLRVRRCQRPACGAWFAAGRMDARSRFCSTTCRVANARDPSAARPARRSTPL